MVLQFLHTLEAEEQQAVLELNQLEDFLFEASHIERPPSMDPRFTPKGTIVEEVNRVREELKRAITHANIQRFLQSILDS